MIQQPYQNNKKNSNVEAVCRKAAEYSSDAPAWPNEQPVIVMPPGSDPISLGMPGAAVYPQAEQKNDVASAAPRLSNTGIQEMSAFLQNNTGKCIRLSFRPESNRTDQIGILLEAGNAYLVLQEFASQNLFLCDITDIQSIHIYNELLPDTSRSLFGI